MLWLLDTLQNPRPWYDPRYFIAAPTRQQVKDIYWMDIKALTPKEWIASINETELSLTTIWNASLHLKSLDAPDRIEGVAWDEGLVDEYATTKPGIWDANIMPALGDREGGCTLTGVPDLNGKAQAEYRNMCKRGASGSDPNWADFAWGSRGILSEEIIEQMRATMDPRLFEQETTGAFIVPGGLAFPDFSRSAHVKPVEYDPALPLRWSLDFNVNPMSSVICQHDLNGVVRVIDEMILPDTVARQAAAAFVGRAKAKGWSLANLHVYGDPAGRARSTAADTVTTTHWTMIWNTLRDAGVDFYRRVRGHSVAIPATVNAVNARIGSAGGESRLVINPSCRELISGLESALAQDDMDEFHALAAFRYYVEREFPVVSSNTVDTISASAA